FVGALSLTAKPGSTCADEIAGLNKRKSVGASLTGSGAAVNGVIHFALAEKLRKMFEPVVDEGVDLLLKKQKDEAKRQLMEGILKSLAPTAKMAEFDGGMSVQGPGNNGLYTVLMGLKVKDGAGIEKALKDLLEKLPGEVKDRVAMDADKAAGTNIHKITPENL